MMILYVYAHLRSSSCTVAVSHWFKSNIGILLRDSVPLLNTLGPYLIRSIVGDVVTRKLKTQVAEVLNKYNAQSSTGPSSIWLYLEKLENWTYEQEVMFYCLSISDLEHFCVPFAYQHPQRWLNFLLKLSPIACEVLTTRLDDDAQISRELCSKLFGGDSSLEVCYILKIKHTVFKNFDFRFEITLSIKKICWHKILR